MEEVWKPIIGYEGIYDISSHGKVRTSKGKQTHSTKHGVRNWKQREMKLKTDKGGYKRVCLYKNKKPKTFLVHRLVAMNFLNKKIGKDIINHIDGNPSNNKIENLEWCDHKENNNHAIDNDLIKTGVKIALYHKITKEVFEFRSMSKAGQFLGKSHGFVSNLLKQDKREYGDYIFFSERI